MQQWPPSITVRPAVFRLIGLFAVAAVTAACGGGGGGPSANGPDPVPPPAQPAPAPDPWIQGVFLPSDTFAAVCAAPRTGTDPTTGQPYPDRAGTRAHENNWLRSWHHEFYLWYDEIIDRDPANYSTPAYFDLMRTFAQTPSGQPKDRFHYTASTAEFRQQVQSGVSAGYGVQWAILNPSVPRQILAAYVQPGSPAALAGIVRGTRVISIDGVDAVNASGQATIQLLNSALFPSQTGQIHTFGLLDSDADSGHSVTLVSAAVQMNPVQRVEVIETDAGRVGYVHFTDHIATAEQFLIDAFTTLEAADIQDLVLDIRYNTGGFLAISSQLAYMIAGPVSTAGRTFERQRFNDKHTATNPFTGEPLFPIPFLDTTIGFSVPAGFPLPALQLPRVFVLTGSNTCSASESLINGLRGVDVEVIQIGAQTCGKPYGFYPADNCGTTYFSIHFQGENEKGFGDFGDGFTPVPGMTVPEATTSGCQVADDFSRALGDAGEARLAAALEYRAWGSCSTGAGGVSFASKPGAPVLREPVVPKPDWLRNRMLTPLP
jgi:carboxyl-terminal processing protease